MRRSKEDGKREGSDQPSDEITQFIEAALVNNIKTGEDMARKRNPEDRRRILDTLIAGTQDETILMRAVETYNDGLFSFISPSELHLDPLLRNLESIRTAVRERIQSVEPLVADILRSINARSAIIHSAEYRELVETEAKQWRYKEDAHLEHGVRACVDAGIPREAVAGSDGHMGRTLAGDDDFYFHNIKQRFGLPESTFSKRLIHNGRTGIGTMLEVFVEHTGCGRRGQMIANLNSESNVSKLYKTVFENYTALLPEFPGKPNDVINGLNTIDQYWREGSMVKDSGVWAGILVKIAQRQAYRHISPELLPIIQIQLYDKMNGDVIVGLDRLHVLTHKKVLQEGGFTSESLDVLISENHIFSMRYETRKLENLLSNHLTIPKGAHKFEELQTEWLDVKKKFVDVSSQLWEMYRSGEEEFVPFQAMVDKFLGLSLAQTQEDLKKVDQMAGEDGVNSDLIKRRLIHQLFRAFAYAWVLDTFERGNPPGKHIEDHLASGDSSVLGVKEHLPLGQGDLQPPTVSEMITGYSVLMHSQPGEKGEPVVAVMKHDTAQPDTEAMTTEETQRAIDDFAELLKLWPYIAVGDIVPVIVVRDKKHGGVSRLPLSVVLSFGDLVDLHAQGKLAEFVPASNSKGEVVNVPSRRVLQAGVEANGDLKEFRKGVKALADSLSDPEIQAKL